MEVIEVPGSDMPCRECLAPQPHSAAMSWASSVTRATACAGGSPSSEGSSGPRTGSGAGTAVGSVSRLTRGLWGRCRSWI